MEQFLNGKNIDEIDFTPGTPTSNQYNPEEFHFGPNATPFSTPAKILDQSEALSTQAEFGDDTHATEALDASLLGSNTLNQFDAEESDLQCSNKEQDAMSMSFYQDKDGANPFDDLNKVHSLPENIDDFLINPGEEKTENHPDGSPDFIESKEETLKDVSAIEGVCHLPASPLPDVISPHKESETKSPLPLKDPELCFLESNLIEEEEHKDNLSKPEPEVETDLNVKTEIINVSPVPPFDDLKEPASEPETLESDLIQSSIKSDVEEFDLLSHPSSKSPVIVSPVPPMEDICEYSSDTSTALITPSEIVSAPSPSTQYLIEQTIEDACKLSKTPELESPHEDITSSVKDDSVSPASSPIDEVKEIPKEIFEHPKLEATINYAQEISNAMQESLIKEISSVMISSTEKDDLMPELCPISSPKSTVSEQTESIATTDVNSFLDRSNLPDLTSPLRDFSEHNLNQTIINTVLTTRNDDEEIKLETEAIVALEVENVCNKPTETFFEKLSNEDKEPILESSLHESVHESLLQESIQESFLQEPIHKISLHESVEDGLSQENLLEESVQSNLSQEPVQEKLDEPTQESLQQKPLEEIENNLLQEPVLDHSPEKTVEYIQETILHNFPQESAGDSLLQKTVEATLLQEPVQDSLPSDAVEDIFTGEPVQDSVLQETVENTLLRESVEDSLLQKTVEDTLLGKPVHDSLLQNTLTQEPIQHSLVQESISVPELVLTQAIEDVASSVQECSLPAVVQQTEIVEEIKTEAPTALKEVVKEAAPKKKSLSKLKSSSQPKKLPTKPTTATSKPAARTYMKASIPKTATSPIKPADSTRSPVSKTAVPKTATSAATRATSRTISTTTTSASAPKSAEKKLLANGDVKTSLHSSLSPRKITSTTSRTITKTTPTKAPITKPALDKPLASKPATTTTKSIPSRTITSAPTTKTRPTTLPTKTTTARSLQTATKVNLLFSSHHLHKFINKIILELDCNCYISKEY